MSQNEFRILDHIHKYLCVTDGRGIILHVSPSWEEKNLKAGEVIGNHISTLEQKGVIMPSVTLKVLEKRKKVTLLQNNRNGERTLCTGVPVFGGDNEILLVVSYDSWDIADYQELKEHYDKLYTLLEHYSIERKIKEISDNFIISKSPQMQNILKLVLKVARADSSILITGESGVGKNLIAKLIHENSPYSRGPLIDINCGAIPETLIESELFGYERGAFTGAKTEGKIGLIELANNGTLLLDEVGELPLQLQVKLLKVLQEKTITRVGGGHPIPVKFRLITATNRDLMTLIKNGKFREDLYYRLNVVPIHIPPLRERPEDLLLLIMSLTSEFCKRLNKTKTFSKQAVDALLSYGWPGNVRELQNIIERIILTSDEELITVDSLPDNLTAGTNLEYQEGLSLKKTLERVEKKLILTAFEKSGTTVGVGKILGISQATAVRKLKKYIKNYEKRIQE
jgi:transcriptional regulator with PAS, ATPase and Fis domain